MTAKQHLTNSTSHVTDWTRYLETETRRFDETGVASAIVSIRLGSNDERIHHRVVGLLGHILNPTDTFSLDANNHLSLVLAPVQGVVALHVRVRALHAKIAELGADPLTGYAMRRKDESLVNTLARADANADRAGFRRERYPSVLVLPDNH